MIEPLESFANEDITVATLYSGANVHDSSVALALINKTTKLDTHHYNLRSMLEICISRKIADVAFGILSICIHQSLKRVT